MPQLEDIYPVLSCIEFIIFWCESFCGAGMSQIFLSYRVAGDRRDPNIQQAPIIVAINSSTVLAKLTSIVHSLFPYIISFPT